MTPCDASMARTELAVEASTAKVRGTDRRRELVDREERRAWQRRLVRATRIAAGGWLAFLAFDLVIVLALEDAPAAPFLGLRLGAGLALGGVIAVVRRLSDPSRMVLRGFEIITFSTGMALIGVLTALHDDGLLSHLVPGSVLVVLAYGVTLGSPWRHALAPVGAMTLALPSVLGAAALFSPRVAAQWRDADHVLTFLVHYGIVLGGAGLTLIGGDALAGLRRQVDRARSIGRYQLRERIAVGGMGEVWSAYHEGLRRDVAVKLIRAGSATDDEVHRFEVEVRTTAELTHPNIVRVFDYGVTDDGIWYYAMELLEAESLQQIVTREGVLAPGRALRLVTQAAQALAEAHGRGIVHRDVKPANLLVRRAGSAGEYVKLIDFGIARLMSSTSGVTRTGTVVGTPGYIAPEVVMGAAADERADVYALGAVLYFMLAGRMPFEADNVQALVLQHVHADVTPPSAFAPEPIPPSLEAIVARCLEKDPAARYADADALARALLACDLDVAASDDALVAG